jgi:O-antigen ligase
MDAAASPKPRLGALLIGAYLFSVPAFGYSDSTGLLAIPQVLGALLVGLAIYDIVGGMRVNIPLELGLYGLLGLWCVLTFLPLSGTTSEDLGSLGTLAKVVATTLACAQLTKDEDDLFLSLKVFIFSVILVYFMNRGELQMLEFTGATSERDRFAGTLTNANTAAIFSLTILWAGVVLMKRSSFRTASVIAYAPPMALASLILYYTGSKKGLMGLALLAVFTGRLLYIRRKPTLAKKSLISLVSLALIGVVGYVIYTSPFFFRIEQLFGGVTNASDMNRLILAKEAVEVWLTNARSFFIGVGYDQFWKFSSFASYAHSTPLELLASNGLIGLALFLGFLGLLLRRFIRLYMRTAEAYLRSEYFGILIFLFIFAFFMLFAVLFDSRELLPILGCLAAFGRGQGRLESAGPAAESLAAAETRL